KIAQIENEIKIEQDKLRKAKFAVQNSKDWIQKIENRQQALLASVQDKYNKKEVLENFISEELERLNQDKLRLADK
ncbi:MAG: hypothetical protein GWN16_08825, partial [Calditrichae bacterium]|nr:hypothetical protein [Calditrichia bacterium]